MTEWNKAEYMPGVPGRYVVQHFGGDAQHAAIEHAVHVALVALGRARELLGRARVLFGGAREQLVHERAAGRRVPPHVEQERGLQFAARVCCYHAHLEAIIY